MKLFDYGRPFQNRDESLDGVASTFKSDQSKKKGNMEIKLRTLLTEIFVVQRFAFSY